MDEDRATRIMGQLNRLHIKYMKVESAPCIGAISSLNGMLEYSNPHISCMASDIFSLTKEQLMLNGTPSMQHRDAVVRLVSVLNDRELPQCLIDHIESHVYEHNQFTGIATYLLKPLCKKFKLNNIDYPKTIRELEIPNAPSTDVMGVGSINTWRGIPDGRSDWITTVAAPRPESRESESSDSESSVGRKAVVEGKRWLGGTSMFDQIVGYAVVHSFIRAQRHPDDNAMVPAICLAAESGECWVAMYDCKQDILLLIDPMPWLPSSDSPPMLNEATIVLVWLILNHYLFLKLLGPQPDKCKSGLLRLFENGNALDHYRSLRNLRVARWMKQQFLPTHPTRNVEIVDPCASGVQVEASGVQVEASSD